MCSSTIHNHVAPRKRCNCQIQTVFGKTPLLEFRQVPNRDVGTGVWGWLPQVLADKLILSQPGGGY